MVILLKCLLYDAPLQIVSKDLSEPVRSHKDLDKDAAPYFQRAVKFYDSLGDQLVSQGHVVDLFASALDQVSILCCLCLNHSFIFSILYLYGFSSLR